MSLESVRALGAAIAMLCFQTAVAQGFRIDDYRRLVGVSSVQLSPDGKRVAFIRSIPNFKTDKSETRLMVVEVASRALKAISDGKIFVSAPRWAPSGASIAYVSQGSNKQDQVFVVPFHGGKPHQITHSRHGVQQFAWSPSGDRIAFVTPDDDPNQAAIDRHDDLFEIGDDGYQISHVAVPSHLWIVASKGGTARRLTTGPWSVLENAAPFVGGPSDPSWSADGRSIAFARQANAHNSNSDMSQIAVVSVTTGAVKALTESARYEYQPLFGSPSNSIAYLRPHGPTPLSVMDVYLTHGPQGDVDLTTNLDRDITAFSWTPGREDLILLGNEGVRARLWKRTALDGQTRQLKLGELSPSEFNVGKTGAIAFVASTATTPPELYVQENPATSPRRLTDFNDELRKLSYGKVTELTWTAPDGEKCDGVLTYPVGYLSGRRYPLVVFSHGGPEAASLAQFTGNESDLLRQPLAAKGYVFFEPNYRGSDNLGNHHEHGIYKDPGEGPASDVLSGLAAVEALDIVDQSHISVAGHSYGGFMTAWLISHDHRWRSAVIADGAVDWKDTYNLTSVGNMAWARDSLGGTPWDPESAELYRSGSPISYANQITTPTFIISGTADETVPITESFDLYHALRASHVPVKFVGVPGAHHTPDDPVRYVRFNELMLQWILQHDR